MKELEEPFFGNAERIAAATPMECGVCWWVYDPALGDPEWQIEPGVAFADLPAHWRCPHCDARQDQFMVYGVEAMLAENERTLGLAADRSSVAAAASAAEVLRQRLQRAYETMAAQMRGQPACNGSLSVEVGRLVQAEDGLVGIAIAPWAMNLIWFPFEAQGMVLEGSHLEVQFPGASYRFTVTSLNGVGRFGTCSLFSTMAEFQGLTSARTVASHILRGLFKAPKGLSPQRTGGSRSKRRQGGKTVVQS